MKTSTAPTTALTPGKSLAAEYKEERENVLTLEYEDGFATYCFPDDDRCYLIDVFVRKARRRGGLCYKMAAEVEQIAKDKGCKYMITTVDPRARDNTPSLLAILNWGYQLDSIGAPLIYFKKEL